MANEQYVKDFNDNSFWDKCKKYCKSIGEECLEKALYLYYATESDKCHIGHKTAIYGALGYLISPIDALPDFTPVLGYTDDASVIAGALVAVASCIDSKVKAKARNRTKEFFS